MRAYSEESFESVQASLGAISSLDVPVQLSTEWSLIESLGVGEILDPFHDSGVSVSAIRVPYPLRVDAFLLEKLVMVAEETEGKTIILRDVAALSMGGLRRIADLCATYKVRALLEPSSGVEASRLYGLVKRLIGGIVGFSHVEENYPSTESFLKTVLAYLGITRNVTLSNYDADGRPAPIMAPKKYNNPLLVRRLVEGGFEGTLTISYEKSPVEEPGMLAGEVAALKEYVRGVYERTVR